MTKRINYPEHPGSTYEEPTYEDPVYQKDNADLLVAIYDYCCRRNYSAALQEYINQTIALLTSKTSNYPYVERNMFKRNYWNLINYSRTRLHQKRSYLNFFQI